MADLRLLTAADVQATLQGRENELMATVRDAYLAHREGRTILPNASPLYFSNGTGNRIIALPAYLGTADCVAGVKWVASFPGNVSLGLDRASALIILNSARDGRAEVLMEGSAVSLCRTAASAALAAQAFHAKHDARPLGIVGCGKLSFETVRFLLHLFPVAEMLLSDLVRIRAEHFAERIHHEFGPSLAVRSSTTAEVLSTCGLVVVGTTAAVPHVRDTHVITRGATILHLSLRDFSPEVLLACDNVVDDADHVSREQTSIHLAEMEVGHRRFVRCTLGDILAEAEPARIDTDRPLIFSPFGLGILDLAVAQFVRSRTTDEGRGLRVPHFHSEPWVRT